jgi:ketosteroid isomerase-like protein
MRLLTVLLLFSVGPLRSPAQAPDAERAIRQRRAASNAAIARHDTTGIGAIMSDSVVVLTSGSVYRIGRAANMQSFAAQFRTRPDLIYVRTPDQVRVFEPWNMASESGRWSGSWTDTDGKIRIGGVYFAKWRLKKGAWLIEGETYVPDRCEGGAYCRTPP